MSAARHVNPNPHKPEVGRATYWLYLDPHGKRAKPPAVPKPVQLGVAGRAWWTWAWNQPQSQMWDDSMAMVIGRRASIENFLCKNPTPALFTQLRQWDETLGLTPRGLLMLHWVIGYAPVAETGGESGIVKIA